MGMHADVSRGVDTVEGGGCIKLIPCVDKAIPRMHGKIAKGRDCNHFSLPIGHALAVIQSHVKVDSL